MSYKIQNRTPDSKRVKVIKRSDGKVLFPGTVVPTYQENTIQAGWCMLGIVPVPELVDPQTTFELSASPMGVNGRVSIYRNETLTSSMRYSNLKSNAEKVTWFNDFFGAVVLMAVIQGITVFTIREAESVIKIVFEDDDIDYVFGDIKPWVDTKTAFFREQYRLAIAVKLTDIDCTGALNFAGELDVTVTNGTILRDNQGNQLPVNTTEELITGLESTFGLQVVELTPYTPPTPETPALKFKIDTPEYDRFISINDWNLDPDTTVTVDWGDGSPIETFTSDSIGNLYHDYIMGASGVCVIRSDKTIPMIWLQSDAVTEITDFGDFGITNPKFSFETLIKVPAVLPTFITDMTEMFYQCPVLNDPSVINWDTSNVTKMSAIFARSPMFNQPIGNWNVSNVTEMWSMFESSTVFNQPLDTWNTANVTDMTEMFKGASAFNQDISAWNVGNVAGMNMMFESAVSFVQNLNQWCVSQLTSLPFNFARWAPQYTEDLYPVWGTCPRGERPTQPNEVYFTTTADTLNYQGAVGDVITYQDGSVTNITSANLVTNSVPAGNHKVKLNNVRTDGVVVLSGPALLEVHNFPTMAEVNSLRFGHPDSTVIPNLVKVPDTLPSNLTDLSYMFHTATSFNQDISMWDTSNVTKMEYMFRSTEVFNQPIGNWNVSNVASFKGMFNDTYMFNQPLNTWDVSKATTISQMFSTARVFNQPLDNWFTTNVTDMSNAFSGAKAFKQNINAWDTSNVTTMANMFSSNDGFNQPIGNWDTSKVTNMSGMFDGAYIFNQDLSQWCVPNILSIPNWFANDAPQFTTNLHPVWGTCPRGENVVPPEADEVYFTTTDGQILYTGVIGDVITLSDGTSHTVVFADGIDLTVPAGKHKVKLNSVRPDGVVFLSGAALTEVHNFPTMSEVNSVRFGDASNLIKVPITLPSNLTDLSYMFQAAGAFNQNISAWDTSNVTNMAEMFFNANSFNQPIGNWDVSSVTNMGFMFNNTIAFNQDISGWDVSKVTNMEYMFKNATAFNRDLSQWCVGAFPTIPYEFDFGSTNWTLPKPVWGTCPRGENVV